VAASVLFGTTGTAQALGPDASTPLTVGAVRLVIGGAALLALVVVLGRRAQALSCLRRPATYVLAAGILAYQPLFFMAAERTGVAVGALVALGSGPLWTGAFAAATGAGAPSRAWWWSTLLAIGGLVMLTSAGSASVDGVGVLAALGAGAAYGVYTVAASRLVTSGLDAITVVGVGFALAAVVVWPLLLLSDASWVATPSGAVAAVWLGVGATALAYVCFAAGLRTLSAPTVASLTLVEPVVASALAVTLLGESWAVVQWVGAAVLLGALALLGRHATRPALVGGG
jgi:DME family drug/metabolite transporter